MARAAELRAAKSAADANAQSGADIFYPPPHIPKDLLPELPELELTPNQLANLVSFITTQLRLTLGDTEGTEAVEILGYFWQQRASNDEVTANRVRPQRPTSAGRYGVLSPTRSRPAYTPISKLPLHPKMDQASIGAHGVVSGSLPRHEGELRLRTQRALDVLRVMEPQGGPDGVWPDDLAAFVTRDRLPPPADVTRAERRFLTRLSRAARERARDVIKLLPTESVRPSSLKPSQLSTKLRRYARSAAVETAHVRASELMGAREYLRVQRMHAEKTAALNSEIERDERRKQARAAKEKAEVESRVAAERAAAREAAKLQRAHAAQSIQAVHRGRRTRRAAAARDAKDRAARMAMIDHEAMLQRAAEAKHRTTEERRIALQEKADMAARVARFEQKRAAATAPPPQAPPPQSVPPAMQYMAAAAPQYPPAGPYEPLTARHPLPPPRHEYAAPPPPHELVPSSSAYDRVIAAAKDGALHDFSAWEGGHISQRVAPPPPTPYEAAPRWQWPPPEMHISGGDAISRGESERFGGLSVVGGTSGWYRVGGSAAADPTLPPSPYHEPAAMRVAGGGNNDSFDWYAAREPLEPGRAGHWQEPNRGGHWQHAAEPSRVRFVEEARCHSSYGYPRY